MGLEIHVSVGEAAKLDHLCNRILGDIGSIHRRVTADGDNGKEPMPPELCELRRYIREVQDAVRDKHPAIFFK